MIKEDREAAKIVIAAFYGAIVAHSFTTVAGRSPVEPFAQDGLAFADAILAAIPEEKD